MKKLLGIALILVCLAGVSNAQTNLKSSIGNPQDTVLVNGSTDAGSRWFTNYNKGTVYLEVSNDGGTYWNTYKVGFPMDGVDSLRGWVEGSDSTLIVQAAINGRNINLPIEDNSGHLAKNLDLGVTAKFLIRFLGF